MGQVTGDHTITLNYGHYDIHLNGEYHHDTVNSLTSLSLIATTSRKRPPPVSDYFVNKRFVSQSNTVLRALSWATTTQISTATSF